MDIRDRGMGRMSLHWVAINGDMIGSQGEVFGTYVTLSYAHGARVLEHKSDGGWRTE